MDAFMKNHDQSQDGQQIAGVEIGAGGKKPYQKPARRRERVFETTALSCGKVQTTQAQCHSNRKLS
jgi:hypothetical protein